MFLRNERDLGVKNGSLGRLEGVTAARMAVLLDDGRHVAFDLKDYAAIDHGYAATVHKAQGVTVDRVHVLATPGFDRHAAYVALSRHRDSVELHYGRDDFADQGKLVRTLSRERAKDMASDYVREFAVRRQIILPTRAPNRVVPSRDRFAGPRLEQTSCDPATARKAGAPERSTALPTAVARHARIVRDMRFSHSIGDDYTAEQRTELASSRTSLDQVRPHAAFDLETAMSLDKGLVPDAAEDKTAGAIRAMQLEAEIRVDPQLRADTFVQRWQALEKQRRMLMRYNEDSKIRNVSQTMLGMAKSLERDPQVESLLRIRKVELGLPAMPTRSVGQSLADMVGIGRSRGLGIGM